jgi:RNA polymerase sigma-70 factor, ECF subfamily
MAKKDDLFEALYKKYRPAVVALFLRFGFDRERALELAQETYIRVYRSMDTWRQEGPWGYLQTTARRIALNELRDLAAAKRSAPVAAIEDLRAEPRSTEPTPAEVLAAADAERVRREWIRTALAELPPRLRAPLVLRLQEVSYKDIAVRLHLTLDAVKSRLHESKLYLRDRLNESPEVLDEPSDE